MDATLAKYSPPKCSINGGNNGNSLPDDICDQLAAATTNRQRGAISTFTAEKATILIESIIEGSTIQAACEKIGIARRTFYVWRELIPDFMHMVTRAQELQADSMVDDNITLLESVDASGREGMANLRKAEQLVRFRWDLIKCLNFNKYGDKKQQLNLNHNINHEAADVSAWFNP